MDESIFGPAAGGYAPVVSPLCYEEPQDDRVYGPDRYTSPAYLEALRERQRSWELRGWGSEK